MTEGVELDAQATELHALSLASAPSVIVGEFAVATALTTAELDTEASLAAENVADESVAVGDIEGVAPDTLTCNAAAELRVNWSELQEWLGRS
jgi:hypothetical protein